MKIKSLPIFDVSIESLGSVMEILPPGNYSEHMPNLVLMDNIKDYWIETGSYLAIAIESHGNSEESTPNLDMPANHGSCLADIT